MALLTVAELRKHLTDHPTGADQDDALRRLLEAAEAAIGQVAGPLGTVTEYSGGGAYYLSLHRPAAAITSIREDFYGTPLVLAANDYQISPNGYVLSRLSTGTNSRSTWYGPVQVIYTARDDTAVRETVQVLLVQQFLNYHPGLTQESIGSWSQSFTDSSVYNFAIERSDILSMLYDGPSMVVI